MWRVIAVLDDMLFECRQEDSDEEFEEQLEKAIKVLKEG